VALGAKNPANRPRLFLGPMLPRWPPCMPHGAHSHMLGLVRLRGRRNVMAVREAPTLYWRVLSELVVKAGGCFGPSDSATASELSLIPNSTILNGVVAISSKGKAADQLRPAEPKEPPQPEPRLLELLINRNVVSLRLSMKPIIDENEEAARAQILHNQVRPTTFALAALIFGIASLSALWLLVVAGLAALCSVVVAMVLCGRRERRSPALLTRPRNGIAP
jgi:hypothetical protein